MIAAEQVAEQVVGAEGMGDVVIASRAKLESLASRGNRGSEQRQEDQEDATNAREAT